MVWSIITLIFSTILNFITVGHQSTLEKDLEILVLRQRLSFFQAKLNSPIRHSRTEKLTLSAFIV
jgi:hypothetical protein